MKHRPMLADDELAMLMDMLNSECLQEARLAAWMKVNDRDDPVFVRRRKRLLRLRRKLRKHYLSSRLSPSPPAPP